MKLIGELKTKAEMAETIEESSYVIDRHAVRELGPQKRTVKK